MRVFNEDYFLTPYYFDNIIADFNIKHIDYLAINIYNSLNAHHVMLLKPN